MIWVVSLMYCWVSRLSWVGVLIIKLCSFLKVLVCDVSLWLVCVVDMIIWVSSLCCCVGVLGVLLLSCWCMVNVWDRVVLVLFIVWVNGVVCCLLNFLMVSVSLLVLVCMVLLMFIIIDWERLLRV